MSKKELSSIPEPDFTEVAQLISAARQHAYQVVNTALIDLYWQVGAYISNKLRAAEWGDGVITQLAAHLAETQPNLQGFTRVNLFRMRQFYEAYHNDPIVSPLVRQTQPQALNVFKDAYVVDFLNLPQAHSEADLHQGLLGKLKQFLTELGRDFCFVGSEFPVQVGKQDFSLDLLFFHRDLNSLVAIELKVERFSPSHLGQLNFYLEALDRDQKKPHENPSIGVLLCAS